MKKICKTPEPAALTHYRRQHPTADWEALKDENRGAVYETIRRQCCHDQGGLCGYCEITLPDTPLGQRIEHFHPKSDRAGSHNWTLDWHNLIVVCTGGDNAALAADPAQYLPPLPANLSCDAYKNHLINKGQLSENCEGYVLNPLHLIAFPGLFALDKSTGALQPHPANCQHVEITPNHYASTAQLVTETIRILNLNCDRLCQQRRKILYALNKEKKLARERGEKPSVFLSHLAKRYFQRRWPAFFTTRRILLGQYAEDYLRATGFVG